MFQLEGSKLKDYTKGFRGVKFYSQGCLLPKGSRVSFDFSELEGVNGQVCQIEICRVSGNGKFQVSSNGDQFNHSALSKSSTIFDIPLGSQPQIEILRTSEGLGDILLERVKIEKVTPVSMPDWKSIINKFDRYRCLKLSRGRLFASSGGYIEDKGLITEVETQPPGVFKRDSGRLVFPESCEITKLILKPSHKKETSAPFPNRKPPTPIKAPQEPSQSVSKRSDYSLPDSSQRSGSELRDAIRSHILFDSNQVGFSKFITKNSREIKVIKSLGKKILSLKKGAALSIPMSVLKPNTDYIITVYGKVLSGNGKLQVGLSGKSNFPHQPKVLQLSQNNASRCVYLTSDGMEGQKLHLMRAVASCSGEILIDRIILVKDVNAPKGRFLEELDYALSGKRTLPTAGPLPQPEKAYQVSDLVSTQTLDWVAQNAKIHAKYYVETPDPQADKTLKCNFTVTTTSGMSWVNRIQRVYPQLGVGQGGVASLSQAGRIKPAPIIWLDVFDELSDKDVKELSKAVKVISPSEDNVEVLKERLAETRVEFGAKPLPLPQEEVVSLFEDKQYIAVIYRDGNLISDLVTNWDSTLPPLVLLGCRGSFPEWVIPVHEYQKYSELAFMLKKARCVVDLPKRSFQSSLLNLSLFGMGKKVVTTNKYYRDNSQVSWVTPEDDLRESVIGAQGPDVQVDPKQFNRQQRKALDLLISKSS